MARKLLAISLPEEIQTQSPTSSFSVPQFSPVQLEQKLQDEAAIVGDRISEADLIGPVEWIEDDFPSVWRTDISEAFSSARRKLGVVITN
jgi:hypothetical protein